MSKVIASWIDETHFGYYCENCDKVHIHGSLLDFTNREEHRISHCLENSTGVNIVIDDTTLRNLKQENMVKPNLAMRGLLEGF